MIDFLDKLGISGGIDVHVCVSPASGVEMITIDSHGNIKSYAQLPFEYNEAQREISDYDQFGRALAALFEMRNIDPKRSNVYLTLPTVWFGIKEGLPLMLDDEAITNVIIGELDQTYVFKQKDSTPFWFDSMSSQDPNSRSVFYTAIQSEAIDLIKNIFTKMGANLVSITCSLVSTLRGLYYTGHATEYMNNDNAFWSLMLINNSGFQMIEMQGRKLLRFYEEPLPLKSYEGDEVYGAMESAIQIALMDSQSNALICVSETDLVSAEILHSKLSFGGESSFIENNTLKKEPLTRLSLNIVPQDQIKVSLGALGAAAPEDLLPISINFLVASGHKVSKNDTIEIPIGKISIRLTPLKASAIAAVLLAVVLGPILFTEFVSTAVLTRSKTENEQLQKEVEQVQKDIDSYSNKEDNSQFDPVKEIEKILKDNRTKIMSYNALGESIPKNIYLTYFIVAENGLINIKGCADSVEEVYVFFKSLKDSLFESKLRLSKLDLKAGSLDSVVNGYTSPIDEAPYIFEITNMDAGQLSRFLNSLTSGTSDKPADGGATEQTPPPSDQNNSNNTPASGTADGEVPQAVTPSKGLLPFKK